MEGVWEGILNGIVNEFWRKMDHDVSNIPNFEHLISQILTNIFSSAENEDHPSWDRDCPA